VSTHVVPVADLVNHETTDDCVCTVGWVVVHHSLDGREPAI
jgi:hypothetical protein